MTGRRRSYLEAKRLHATPVLVDGRVAVLGRVGGVGEQHALVPLGLLILADTARLFVAIIINKSQLSFFFSLSQCPRAGGVVDVVEQTHLGL